MIQSPLEDFVAKGSFAVWLLIWGVRGVYMFLRSEPRWLTLIRAFVLGIFSIILISTGAVSFYRSHSAPVDLNDPNLNWKLLKGGQHVVMDIDFLAGQYMHTTSDGAEKYRDYLMPHIVYYEEKDLYIMTNFIGVKLNNGSRTDYATADTIISNSQKWWNDTTGTVEYNTTTLHMDGYLQKMDEDQLSYSKEFLREGGFSEEDISIKLVPYYICNNSSSGHILIILGIVTALAGAGLTIFALKKKMD